ncbi:MAG: 4Fe-4S binding protein, partial [Anaerolineae bacterium]
MDTGECDGCGECVAACPYDVLEVAPNDMDPLADTMVAAVTEEER